MQIVIDIPKDLYEKYINENNISDIQKYNMLSFIRKGTVLPKGHGRLIDAGEYVDVLNNTQIEGLNTYKGLGRAKELLIETHTIIEADKAESEDKE